MSGDRGGRAKSPLRVVVVDDEPLARESLRLLLAEDPEVEVVGEHGGGPGAAEAVARMEPDLLFLDVEMPGGDGFEVLQAVAHRGLSPGVVFVTAYDEHAVRAFEVEAVDYLLKPFGDGRFRSALARAKERLHRDDLARLAERMRSLVEAGSEPGGAAGQPVRPRERLLLRAGGRVIFLGLDEIRWVEAADYYARVHAAGGAYLVRRTLSDLEEELDSRFLRVHRSAIVHLDRVREVRRRGRAHRANLDDGTEVPVSRNRRGALERALAERR